uniref:DNA-directed RNA polymerase n=1 Tax=Cyanoptyche gloeocystis TaxID=77922 RepID=A0A3G1IWC2_9EUKA|nr:RNA polymerase beta'' subunit [Cyanoptyche gloeocystis]
MTNSLKKNFYYNCVIDKKQLKKIMLWTFTNYEAANVVHIVDYLKDLGFHYATKAGFSISLDDLKIPTLKRDLLSKTENEININERRYIRGEITIVEKIQNIINIWNKTSILLKEEVISYFKKTDPLNSVYVMAFSGARGNISQVHQLVGMRGLMANPQGQIIIFPIKSNFKEGLTTSEYFISSYGARKGLIDTALRTADSGYLTRRLVDVAQAVIIHEVDCATQHGILLTNFAESKKSLEDRLVGRILLQNIYHPKTHALIAQRNQDISITLAQNIVKNGITQIWVRSPLTCEAKNTICQYCYGWNLANCSIIQLGEAVGIIAAQSIGEPGTQLTMRTFHTGGVFSGDIKNEITQIKAPFCGKIIYPDSKNCFVSTVHCLDGSYGWLLENNLQIFLQNTEGKKISLFFTKGSIIYVLHNQFVEKNQLLAQLSINNDSKLTTEKQLKNLTADFAGEICFGHLELEENRNYQGVKAVDKTGGSFWILSGDVYNIPSSAKILVKRNDYVKKGDVLGQRVLNSKIGGKVQITKKLDNNIDILNIIQASVILEDAYIKEDILKIDALNNISYILKEFFLYFANNYKCFHLKIHNGSKIFNNQVIAELVDSQNITYTGGWLKFLGLHLAKRKKGIGLNLIKKKKVKKKSGKYYEVLKGGTVLWIPEETHKFFKYKKKKLLVKDGQFVDANTEIFKGIFCKNSGIIKIVKINNFVVEVIIKPGKLYTIDNYKKYRLKNKSFVKSGTQISNNLTIENCSYVEFISKTFKKVVLLVRPVFTYYIPNEPFVPKQTFFSFKQLKQISIKTIQIISYKDKERIKSIGGITLLRTLLVVKIKAKQKNLSKQSVTVEFFENKQLKNHYNLQLSISENFLLRKNKSPNYSNQSFQSLVANGKEISSNTKIGYINTLCKTSGEIRVISKNITNVRRVLIISQSNIFTILLNNKPLYKNIQIGDFLRFGDEIANNVFVTKSGEVIEINQKHIKLRKIQPYLLSKGAALQIDHGNLVQQDETLAMLVFERIMTSDITQGLPRVEKLLEARKLGAEDENQKKQLSLLDSENDVIYDNLEESFFEDEDKIQQVQHKKRQLSLDEQSDDIFISSFSEQQELFSQGKQKLIDYTKEVEILFDDEQNMSSEKFNLESDRFSFSLKNKLTQNKNNYKNIDNQIFKDVVVLIKYENFYTKFKNQQNLFFKFDIRFQQKDLDLFKNKFFDDLKFVPLNKFIALSKEKNDFYQIKIFLKRKQKKKETSFLRKTPACILAQRSGIAKIISNKKEKTKLIEILGLDELSYIYELEKEHSIIISNCHFVEATQPLTDGVINPHKLLDVSVSFYGSEIKQAEAVLRSFQKVRMFLLQEVQSVYESQGIEISDKHVEIILRQMTSKVIVESSGNTNFIETQFVKTEILEKFNKILSKTGQIKYKPIILGITKASLNTGSFISAASFQETTRVLANAAVKGKVDWLKGLKENVITGHLIPAGTGFKAQIDLISGTLKKTILKEDDNHIQEDLIKENQQKKKPLMMEQNNQNLKNAKDNLKNVEKIKEQNLKLENTEFIEN